MSALLLVTGLLSLIGSGLVATTIKSDIQLQIVVTCFLSAMILFGLSAVLSGQKALRKRLDERPPV